MNQKCISCELDKSIDEFEKRADTGKYRSQCKVCRNNYVKSYKSKISSGELQKKQILIVDNKKICSICDESKDLSEFPTRSTENGYRHECKDCKKEIMSKYYVEIYNEVRRDRKKNDPEYKLLCNHRNYVYKCLTKFGNKNDRSLKYLGCSLENFKEWLEFQFDENMTWENYGKYWTVDHILPLHRFDLTNEKESLIAFNWKNMQPLTDNFNKGNKIRLHDYFNAFVSATRFISNKKLDKEEYQSLSESLNWLRAKLRYGDNLLDEGSSRILKRLK